MNSRLRWIVLGIALLAIAVLFMTPVATAQEWNVLLGGDKGPQPAPANAYQSVGYDPGSNRMIIFGGNSGSLNLNDTWVLDGADGTGASPKWIHLNASNLPPGMHSQAAAYDEVSNRLMVYGSCLGFCLNLDDNVYVLSNANGLGGSPTWQKLVIPGTHPLRRQSPTVVYDPGHNRLILFGGTNGTGGTDIRTYNDVWVLSNANGSGGTPSWKQLQPAAGFWPSPRSNHIAVYDPVNNRMIVSMGLFQNGHCPGGVCDLISLGDTWVLTNANGLENQSPQWKALGTGAISARQATSGVYDQTNNRLIVFGGTTLQPQNTSGVPQYFNDVWILTNANGLGSPVWQQLSVPIANIKPAPRSMSYAVYVPATNRMVLFSGGNSANSTFNDTFVLTTANGIPGGDWPQFRHAAERASYNRVESLVNPSNVGSMVPKWSVMLNGGRGQMASPAVANGTVYVGSVDGKFSAFNATNGQLLWQASTGAQIIFSSAAISNGIVFVGSDDGKLYAFNAGTGGLIWAYPTAGRIWSSPALANGIVYVGSNEGNLYALNATTGSLNWKKSLPSLGVNTPAVADGIVYVATFSPGKLYALDAVTGATLWSAAVENDGDSGPTVANGILYMATNNGLLAFNAKSGGVLWTGASGFSYYSAPAVANGVVYVGAQDSYLYAFNAITGDLLWRHLAGGQWGINSSPAVANGVVYVGSTDWRLWAFHATTGELLGSFRCRRGFSARLRLLMIWSTLHH